MTPEELQQLQTIIQATVGTAVAPLITRLDHLEQGQQNLVTRLEQTEQTLRDEMQTVERTLTEKLEQAEQRLAKKLNELEYLAADYQDREIRKLSRRVAFIEKQLQITHMD